MLKNKSCSKIFLKLNQKLFKHCLRMFCSKKNKNKNHERKVTEIMNNDYFRKNDLKKPFINDLSNINTRKLYKKKIKNVKYI